MGWRYDDFERADFDQDCWLETRETLINELLKYQSEFQIESWNRKKIQHFLEMKDFVYRGKLTNTHVRQLLTIMLEE